MFGLYLLWLISLILLPFFQGGYFYHEALIFGVIQSGILIIHVLRGNFKKPNNWMMKLLGVIFFSALISTYSAVDKDMHFIGMLKFSVPLIWLFNLESFYHLFGKKILNHIMTVIIGTSVLMSLILIVSLVLFDFDSSFVSYFLQNNRVGGFFQYANTYGIYMFGSFVLVLVSKYDKTLTIVLSSVILCSGFLTQSRGLSLVIIVFLILLTLIRRSYRFALLPGVAGYLLSLGIIGSRSNMSSDRILSLGENTSEWLSRLLYYEDGLGILNQFPTGLGHGGYYYIHRAFQTGATYKVRYIHNSLIQFGLDYGWLAMIAFGFILLLPITFLLKDRKLISNESFVILGLGGLGIGAHSIIDFDMEFTAFVILYFFMLWMLEEEVINTRVARDIGGDFTSPVKRFIRVGTCIVITAALLYIGVVTGLNYYDQHELAYQMYPGYTRAVTGILNDESSSYSDSEKQEIALNALEHKEYYVTGIAFLKDYYYNNGDLEKAADYSKKRVQLVPLRMDYYEEYVIIAWEYVFDLYKRDELTTENTYLADITNIAQYMKKLENQRQNNYNIKHQAEFIITQDMYRAMENAVYIYNKLENKK